MWSNDKSIPKLHIAFIDEEHREILIFLDSILNGKEDYPEASIRGFKVYLLEHFQHEEYFMSRKGYPEYEQHAAAHKVFVEGIHSGLFQEPLKVLEIQDFFALFVGHIASYDAVLVNWLATEKMNRV